MTGSRTLQQRDAAPMPETMVGAEMISSSDCGLGWVIYEAKEFLNADVIWHRSR
jgi:ABC-type nitrate/sulfonate/bicarbonate transport system permease component